MGFTTGFTGGVTLTLGIAYLTVLTHERNRQNQALALRSQSRVLTGLLEPTPLPPPQSRAELAREERSTLVEAAKDRWNSEIERSIRWLQRTDWDEVREGLEGAASRLLGGGLQKSREGIEEAEKQAAPKVQEAVDRSKAAAKKATEDVSATVEKATSKAVSETKAKTAPAVADAKTGAREAADSIGRSGGTVDAARGAVRGAVQKGIQKGKEVLGKAQVAVEQVKEKVESASEVPELDPVERTIQQRYESRTGPGKTPEEIIEERYKSV